MKRRLLSTLTAVAVTLTFPACDKKPEEARKETTEPSKPATVKEEVKDAVKEAVKSVAQPAAQADASQIAGTYGFVAQLPKDVEAFGASYRLHDLWEGLANSKWAATLLELPPIKSSPEVAQAIKQWNSPEGQKARELLQGFFGNEYEVAVPAGFAAKAQPWVALFSTYQQTMVQAYFSIAMSAGAGKPDPAKMQQIFKDAAPQLLPLLVKCDVPPMLFAFKADKVRPVVDDAVKQALQNLPPVFETSTFKLSDKYEFQSLSAVARKLVPAEKEQEVIAGLTQMLGDEAKAKEVMAAALTKRAEIAWGWVGDTLVVSLGTDHSNLKLAANPAESVLTVPDVAKRATQFAGQKPRGLSYVSKSLFDSFAGKIEFADTFKNLAEDLGGILKPDQINAMVSDARRLEKQAQAIFTPTFDSMVQVDVWEDGFRSEIFGGAKNRGFDSSKPLTFSALAGARSFLFADARSNAAQSKATTDFIEDAVSTVWDWYEKYGRTMVKEGERQQAAMLETMVKPMVVEFWHASRKLGQGLGDESAFVLDLAGPMPKIPNLPPFLADAKVPRIAWVSELKDRAAIGEAWKGYWSLVKQLSALAGPSVKIPEPQSKQDGDAELDFVPLPMPTDDLMPHVAITKDRWILSTSPSFTKEIVSKGPAPAGNALGGHWVVNFSALYDYADSWLAVADKNAAQMFGGKDAEEFAQTRPIIDAALKLARSLESFEGHAHEEGGVSRYSLRLKIHDLQ